MTHGSPSQEPWVEYEARLHSEFHRNGHDKYCAWSGVNDVTEREIADFELVLNSAGDEAPLQRYLTDHLSLVIGEWGPQCRWVIPQASLGGRFVPDFLVARINSGGVRWRFVEIETPVIESLFTKKGHPRRQLAQGIKQINDWRFWCSENLDMARRPINKGGLGLTEIYPADGIVVIGRADQRTDDDRVALRQLEQTHQIQIMSYDRLAREARDRLKLPIEYGATCEECGIL
ncbi:Shedu anti-phage system protein SduA domain-containing protein [Nocardia salmonicida]|uniref:Shedu anti-phage system protein SduA domain-containing protein n=1 Tax=Nocardia salmonicida TaxID=53431 RepID=UPI003446FA58